MCARALPEPDLFQKIVQKQLTDHSEEKLAAPARRYQAGVPSPGHREGLPNTEPQIRQEARVSSRTDEGSEGS